MLNSKKNICPVCGDNLKNSGHTHDLKQVMEMWGKNVISQKVQQEHLSKTLLTTLYRCPTCELEIFLPQVIGEPSFYEAISKTEDNKKTIYYEDSKWDFIEARKDLSNPESSLIEFGCGPGNFLSLVKNKSVKSIGIEFNAYAVQLARNKGLTVYDSMDFPKSNEQVFDYAFTFHVLEHVGDPMQLIKSMVDQVKPKGYVGISVPNQNGPIKYIDPCIMNMPPHHATRWKLKTFQFAAKKLGLKVKRFSYEPLLLENHSYYSVYLPKVIFPSNKWHNQVPRSIITLTLRVFFGTLKRVGFKNFPFLKGQSIYVLLEKN